MENIKNVENKLSDYTLFFLEQMSITLDTTLYFYGSIKRYDYYNNQSDIDIDIFTDNIQSMNYKLFSFLNKYNNNVENNTDIKFKQFVLKTKYNELINGYKVSYKNKQSKLFLEINIFNEKYKKNVLDEHNYKTHLPLHIIILLSILKFSHYTLQILSINNYRYYKSVCLNYLMNGNLDEYINLEI